MTNKELNRDIKRLATYSKWVDAGGETDLGVAEAKIKKELYRLYHADEELKVATHANLRRLIRLNVRWRAIPLHMFGIRIEL